MNEVKTNTGKSEKHKEIIDFFDVLLDYKNRQEAQKKRGLNDYNIFTSVLSADDEVRLHTRFLFSLLNPKGVHYQGTLFLEIFIKVAGLEGFRLNIEESQVYKEYNYIDLYITDGYKHVILENKIHAGDGEKQISRYIEGVMKENKISHEAAYDRIHVIYLSLGRELPSSESIKGYEVVDNLLVNGKKRVRIKSIQYDKDIVSWLHACRREVGNITNLNEALRQYTDVVHMVNNRYKEKIMTISEFLGNNLEYWKIYDEVGRGYDTVMFGLYSDVSKELFEYVKKETACGVELEAFETLRRSADTFLYAGRILYINFFMKSKVIVQLELDSYFNLRRMRVQFYRCEGREKKTEEIIPYSLRSKNSMEVYEILSNENMSKLLAMYDKEFIDKIDSIINEYK